MNIAIIGVGYVGLTTGISLAYLGNKVSCVDIDEKKINDLRTGSIPIYEPGLEELYKLSKEHLLFTTDYEEALKDVEVIFITVGTPSNPDGSIYLQYVKEAATEIGYHIHDEGVIVVNKSTVPTGCGNWVEVLVNDAYKIKNPNKAKCQVHVVSNPEFLKEGTAIYDTFYPDRIVIGGDFDYACDKLLELYQPIINQSFTELSFLKGLEKLEEVPVIMTNLVSAELIKYSANAFLASKISFINEIATISEKVGADIIQIAKGIGLDQRIGSKFLGAGIGWGGSCFGKDTSAMVAIADEYGIDVPMIEAARKVNYRYRDRVVAILQEELKILKGKTISLLGISFKPNTDDLRDSPAVDIARKLKKRGAKVKVYDPVSMERAKEELVDLDVKYVDTYNTLFEEADAIILATDWPQFRDIKWSEYMNSMNYPFIFDGRNMLDSDELKSLGYTVRGVGR